ncbi:MAG: hypothetical protein ABL933_15190 [Methyloglobulus sp.]
MNKTIDGINDVPNKIRESTIVLIRLPNEPESPSLELLHPSES